MRKAAEAAGDLQHLQAWAGQGVGLVRSSQPAAEWATALWAEARERLN